MHFKTWLTIPLGAFFWAHVIGIMLQVFCAYRTKLVWNALVQYALYLFIFLKAVAVLPPFLLNTLVLLKNLGKTQSTSSEAGQASSELC